LVPESGRLQELVTVWIGKCPAERGKVATVGRREPLKRLRRLFELAPCSVG
jgi:hypothetical protein